MKTKIVGIEQGSFTNKEGEVINFNSIYLVNEDEGIYCGGIPWKESLPNKLFVKLNEIYETLKLSDDTLFGKQVHLTYNMRTKKLQDIDVLNV